MTEAAPDLEALAEMPQPIYKRFEVTARHLKPPHMIEPVVQIEVSRVVNGIGLAVMSEKNARDLAESILAALGAADGTDA